MIITKEMENKVIGMNVAFHYNNKQYIREITALIDIIFETWTGDLGSLDPNDSSSVSFAIHGNCDKHGMPKFEGLVVQVLDPTELVSGYKSVDKVFPKITKQHFYDSPLYIQYKEEFAESSSFDFTEEHIRLVEQYIIDGDSFDEAIDRIGYRVVKTLFDPYDTDYVLEVLERMLGTEYGKECFNAYAEQVKQCYIDKDITIIAVMWLNGNPSALYHILEHNHVNL